MREHNSVKDNKDICERGYEPRQDKANQAGGREYGRSNGGKLCTESEGKRSLCVSHTAFCKVNMYTPIL